MSSCAERIWQRLSLGGAILLLSACATTPPPPPPADPDAAWDARRDRLEAIENWNLSGRISMSTEEESGHASMSWRQEADRYDIRLRAPLGAASARLAGGRNYVTLYTDDGGRAHGSDPEALLYRVTGWWIPVEALRYWIVGLPAPRLLASWTLDRYGRLSDLEQAGWHIEFKDYERAEGSPLELPSRLFVSNESAEVRLAIGSWEGLDAQLTRKTSLPPAE